ncbi:MAG: acyl-CoA dehydrogenase family protein [Acidimicrobiia bacterium]
MSAESVRRAVEKLAESFAADRSERQMRTTLAREDFGLLAEAGLQTAGLPAERDGLWHSLPESTRSICEIYRILAHGDSSVALVCAMHPAVLSFWLATPHVPELDTGDWSGQRTAVFDSVEQGAWWGTITSEPGSGGDVHRSRAVARRDADAWRLSGQKHFGSGSGITSYMVTTAVPDGEEDADWFYVPVEGNPFDGSAGITLMAPWDGHGMRATQSHALAFADCPVERFAWPGHLDDLIDAAAPFIGTLFTAVVLGILETATAAARAQLAPKAESLRPYEQVEWAQAELEAWTAEQAYEGMLRAIESGNPARGAALRGKTIAAQLAESCLLRICRVLGGGTFARHSPFGHWFEDVRALGFLRPPWGLAYDGLVADSWEPTTGGPSSPGSR